jgi:hypothetical protein
MAESMIGYLDRTPFIFVHIVSLVFSGSLTIRDVRYVIDFCLTKILMADPETNYVSLQLK